MGAKPRLDIILQNGIILRNIPATNLIISGKNSGAFDINLEDKTIKKQLRKLGLRW